jgi:acetyltransferase-like isoleucine patch superfamily enzyme
MASGSWSYRTLDRWRARLRSPLKSGLAVLPDLAPGYWRWVYFRGGIEGINALLLTESRRTVDLLRAFGATVGPDCSIHAPLILNASADFTNLLIGRHVYLGQGISLDLGGRLTIEDQAAIGMGSILLTHQDVGDRPLALHYPRTESPVTIGRGVYLGAGTVVLPGVSIGPETVVAAGSVVTRSLPGGVMAAGVPAEIKRNL